VQEVPTPSLLTHNRQRLKCETLRNPFTASNTSLSDPFSCISDQDVICKQPKAANSLFEEPTQDELFALACECFPPIEESRVVITEYSVDAFRTFEYTLDEVLASNCILQPQDLEVRVRWIYVEYYKIGTFWGSDHRFAQWGTDPALFEKSPILLLQDRLTKLDQEAGRPSLEDQDIVGKQQNLCRVNCSVHTEMAVHRS
jgi:hypothetical protein